eukprot:2786064-Amphidinium_carterae.2
MRRHLYNMAHDRLAIAQSDCIGFRGHPLAAQATTQVRQTASVHEFHHNMDKATVLLHLNTWTGKSRMSK